MMRILTCGFEMRSSAEQVFESIGPNSPTLSLTGSPRVAGGNGVSMQLSGSGTWGSGGYAIRFPERDEIYCRVGVIYNFSGSMFGGDNRIALRNDQNQEIFRLNFIANGVNTPLNVLSSNGTLGITQANITAGIWMMFEFYYKHDASDGRAVVRVDGATVFDFTGNTNPEGLLNPSKIVFRIGHTGGSMQANYDDLAVNDTYGDRQNSWCGDGVILVLLPNGNGTYSGWLGSDGNSVNNYQLVDENPFNSDTDYVAATQEEQIDSYQVADMPTIPVGSTITLVQPVAVAKNVGSGEPSYLRAGLKSGTTLDFDGGNVLPFGYGFLHGNHYFVDPDTELAWDPTSVNALEVAIRSK